MSRYLVIGGTSGVGYATAALLVQLQSHVTIVGRSRDKLDAALAMLDSIHATNIYAEGLEYDVTGEASVFADAIRELATKEREKFSGIFLSTGGELIRPLAVHKPMHIQQQMDSLLSPLLSLGKVAKVVLEPSGSIVVMSSVAAHRGIEASAVYSATRAAVESAVRSMAIELAPHVRVNAIAAGGFRSPLHDRLILALGRASKEYEAKFPLGFGTAEDVAAAVLFLLTPQSRWVTGTTLVVDGGYLARG